KVKKILAALFAALCLLAPAALANINNAGYIEANLDSDNSSYTPSNWGDLPIPPRYYLMNRTESTANNCAITVGFRVRDDSRLAGYANRVEGTLSYYDYATQSWEPNSAANNTFVKAGANDKWGKYDNFEPHSWVLAQPYPVTRYSLGLVADTDGVPIKRVWQEFYVAKCFPYNPQTMAYLGNKSDKIRNAAPAWYAQRMEIAKMLRHLKKEWSAMSSTMVTTVNFDDEMRSILDSAASLGGPASAGDYAQNSGMEALGLAADIFGSATTSTLVSAGGEIYEAYQTYKWCADTLNSSMNTFNSALAGATMQYATAAANQQSNPSSYLEATANAVEAEANELINIVYTNPNNSPATWKTLLAAERDQFNGLMGSITSARGTDTGVGADAYLSAAGAAGVK
ncbi:MAG TPA: hypothetical protein VMT55_01020, partial [Candidatus Sulfotelmatobacter sp.]|nr:hypothetical protein [Candidatus Sulfotelmatobacter sp.]